MKRRRTRAELADDRRTILHALEEAGPVGLRIDELLRDAWGITRDYEGEELMRRDLEALERDQRLVAQWPGTPGYAGAFLTYRLATLEDLELADDRAEIARMLGRWEPHGEHSGYWDQPHGSVSS